MVGFFCDEIGLPQYDVRVWFPGSKGAHVVVNLLALGIEPSATSTADMKAVVLGLVRCVQAHGAPDLNTDPAVYSLPRMLRAPDQLNPKSSLYKVELSQDELFRLTGEEIVGLARSPRGPVWQDGQWSTLPIRDAAGWWAEELDKARKPREFRHRTAELAGVKLRPDGYVVDILLSPVGAFVRERCVVGPQYRCCLADLYAAWSRWCASNGRDHPGTVQSFGRDLAAAVPAAKTRRNNATGRFIEGVALAAT